ncbi:MAG: hypothetical protein JWN70_4478 [Planctomycetaceae bacterium]|nr:hypothetical protein [Planctomycetaceae bacterium]
MSCFLHPYPGRATWCLIGICLLVTSLSCSETPPVSPPPAMPPKNLGTPAQTPAGQRPTLPRMPISEHVKRHFEADKREKELLATEEKQLPELEAPHLKVIEEKRREIRKFVKSLLPEDIDISSLSQAPAATTVNDENAELYQIRIAEVEHYDQLTQDPPAAREPSIKFLRAYIASATSQKHLSEGSDLLALGKGAIAAGSKDPLVRLHLVMAALTENSDLTPQQIDENYKTLMEVGPVLIAEKRYPRLFAFQARTFRLDYSRLRNVDETLKVLPEILPAWIEWLVEMSQEGEHQQMRLYAAYGRTATLLGHMPLDLHRRAYLAALREPRINPWIVHMIGGNYHDMLGWSYRGGGFANTVTAEGWKKLAEHSSLAKDHYNYAYFLQPRIAAAPNEMMRVALTQSEEVGSVTEWFLRTTNICFDKDSAYSQLRNALKPRWGGSIAEMVSFSVACLKTKSYQTLVPTHGLDFLVHVQQAELGSSGSIFKGRNKLLATLGQYADGLDAAVKAAPKTITIAGDSPFYRCELAALLTSGGDLARARAVLLPVAHQVADEPYFRLQRPKSYSVGLALAAVPELADRLLDLDKIIMQGAGPDSKAADYDQAQETLQAVRKAHNIPDGDTALQLKQDFTAADQKQADAIVPLRIRQFVLTAETTLQRLRQYCANDWVKLNVDDQGSGWSVYSEPTAYHPPDAIDVSFKGTDYFYQIRSLARFAPPYDVQVEVESSGDVPGRYQPLYTGIAIGATDYWAFSKKSTGTRLFGVNPGKFMGAIQKKDRVLSTASVAAVPTGKSYHVRVQVWDGGRYRFSVNNLRIAEGTDPEFDPGNEIHFGMGFPQTQEATAKLSQMRIRRLTEQPPADPNDYAAVEAFARDELKFDSQDAMAQFDLGRALFGQGKYAAALTSLKSAEGLRTEFMTRGLLALKAMCYSKLGQFESAIAEYEKLQKINYQSAINEVTSEQARCDFARLLATVPDDKLRDGPRALKSIQRLINAAKSPNWEQRWILAAAHAECGDFEDASKAIQDSLALAPEEQKAFVEKLKKLFEAKKPYRLTKSTP